MARKNNNRRSEIKGSKPVVGRVPQQPLPEAGKDGLRERHNISTNAGRQGLDSRGLDDDSV